MIHVVSVILFSLFAAHPATSTKTAQSGLVSISYSLPSKSLVLHQPVILQFSARNNTGETAKLDLGQDRKGSYQFWVTNPEGKLPELPQYEHQGMSRLGQISLAPGETFSQEVVIDEWYSFAAPGTYVVSGKLTTPILVGRVSSQQDAGFRDVIHIGPEDPARLASECNTLAMRVEAAQTYEGASHAALALSYVNDKTAIPYLQRVLFSHRLVEGLAISGLERIGDRGAVRVLGDAISAHLPGYSTIQARQALQAIQRRTNDPVERELITEILAQKR